MSCPAETASPAETAGHVEVANPVETAGHVVAARHVATATETASHLFQCLSSRWNSQDCNFLLTSWDDS